MKITSNFAILDVKQGRKKLASAFEKSESLNGEFPDDPVRIAVVIHGFIDGVHSQDDGTSIEFSVDVQKVEISK